MNFKKGLKLMLVVMYIIM